jgi:membrane protein
MRQRFERTRRVWTVVWDAINRFLANDNWAIASDIALSVLMSLFPFLIIVTATASMLGSRELAQAATDLVLGSWPRQVAGPLSREITRVLTGQRQDLLTIGAVLALYFASNGVQSVRIGLNRAYGVPETRHWTMTRLESIGFVVLGTVAVIAIAFLVVLGPVLWRGLVTWIPALEPFQATATAVRFVVATCVLVTALFIAHFWLPAGWRRPRDIWPGLALTLLGWLGAGAIFGWYLDSYAANYISTYAGLATGMIALVFLYFVAAIFLFGGELNAAIRRERAARVAVIQDQSSSADAAANLPHPEVARITSGADRETTI